MLAAALATLALAPPPLAPMAARQALLSSSLLSQSTSLFVAAANSADTCQSYAPGGGTDIDPVQGAALAAVATFILSFGYNTETNKKREGSRAQACAARSSCQASSSAPRCRGRNSRRSASA